MVPNTVSSTKPALFVDRRVSESSVVHKTHPFHGQEASKPSVVHKTVDFKVAYIEGQVDSCLAIFSTASRQHRPGGCVILS